jgi:hypothetical protein
MKQARTSLGRSFMNHSRVIGRIVPRFGLRTLFCATLVSATLLFAAQTLFPWETYRREQSLINAVQVLKASYKTELHLPHWIEFAEDVLPHAVSRLIPHDAFRRTEAVKVWSEEIDNEWCRHLQNAERLRTVILWAPRLDDECLKYFLPLDNLERLDISQTSVTDAGVPTLARLKKLQSLVISETDISESGVNQLRQLLPNTEINTVGCEYSFAADGY